MSTIDRSIIGRTTELGACAQITKLQGMITSLGRAMVYLDRYRETHNIGDLEQARTHLHTCRDMTGETIDWVRDQIVLETAMDVIP